MSAKFHLNIPYGGVFFLSVLAVFTTITLGSIKQAQAVTRENLNEARNGARIECARARRQSVAVRRSQQDLTNARQRYERAKAALRRESANLKRISKTYRRILPKFKYQARICRQSKQSYEIMKQMLGQSAVPPRSPSRNPNRRNSNTPQRGLLGIEAPPTPTPNFNGLNRQ